MSEMLINEEFILVIDTDSESLDFAHKLCAYCTGFTREDDTDQQFSDMFYMENGIEDDDSPKGKTCDQKNIFYESITDRKDESEVYSPCCVWLNRNYGCHIETNEYAKITEENYADYDLPAPFSVGIFFEVEPTAEQIKIIKERSVKFFADVWQKISGKKVTVEGFRLIVHKKIGEEREI